MPRKGREIFYKMVQTDGKTLTPAIANSTFEYSVGVWMRVDNHRPLAHCHHGFHVATRHSIRYWWEEYGPVDCDSKYLIFEAKIGRERLRIDFDNRLNNSGKICARSLKLLRRVSIAELKRRKHWN